ncbi:MAG: S8 family serine peptidase, partial [Alphaproteobacteria bacterium]
VGAVSQPIGGRSYMADEVLAINLSPRGASRARKLGFQVHGQVGAGGRRGQNVTRLVAPRGMGAMKARTMLGHDLPPGEQIALNQIHHPYRVANKDNQTREPSQPIGRRSWAGCPPHRCFARRVIRWHDTVQSCTEGLRIGVIDTHIDQAHPAFSRAKLSIGDFVSEGRKVASSWHGTGVTALLAGDPRSGTPGLIPNAQFYEAGIFFQDSTGETATDTFSVLSALEWMEAFDVQIINMSFSGPKDELIQKTIRRMAKRGVLFIAAAGNDGPTVKPNYPAAYPEVVSVTAVTRELHSYAYANRGERIDVAAPGVNIWSAIPLGRAGYHTGTSFAAPYATAVLATVYNSGPSKRKEDVLNRLTIQDLGAPGRDAVYGRGLITAPTRCGKPGGGIAQVPADQITPNTALPSRHPTAADTEATYVPSGSPSFR